MSGPVVVTVEVGGVPAGLVSMHTERGPVHRATVPDDGTVTVEWRTRASQAAFVRVEVRHPDGMMAAMANPILLA